MAESLSLSRATSLSRASKNGSTKSRSLIKKNIEMQDLNPADLLIERFTAWKIIVKQLVSYFEGVADIENNTAREMTKLVGVIQVPFRSGNQFLGEGGLQDVFYGIRDKTRQIADQHADLGRTVDGSIVQHLQKLLAEVKAHLKNVQNDTAKLAAGVAKEREVSTRLIGELANDVSAFRNTPMNLTAKMDPYLANQAVTNQLQKQVLEENLLQKSIVMMQQNSAHFEEGIVRAIQSAWQTFDEWQSRASLANQEIYRSLSAHLAALPADREWISFAARSDHLLDPETPLRDPGNIQYPLKEDPSVFPVHSGYLERKRRFTRAYQESYFTLTPAGFLHAFTQSDPSHPSGHGLTPTFSLFLPICTLGPPSAPNSKSHKFHIEGRKDGTGSTKTGSIRGLLGGDNSMAWTFRARSQEDMMEWWNDIRMLCARYLIASEQVERNGPVETAVRSAGYISTEEEEGSSVEEGVDDHEPGQDTGLYGDEKGSQRMDTYAYMKNGSGYERHDQRHSIRRQEKAPGGRTPRAYYDEHDDGPDIDQPQPADALSSSYDRSAQIRGAGYIPEDLRRSSHIGRDAHDSHYAQPPHARQTQGAPQARILDLPPGLHRTISPRSSNGSSTHSSHRLPSYSHQGPPNPREGTSSPGQVVSPQRSFDYPTSTSQEHHAPVGMDNPGLTLFETADNQP